MKKHIAEELPSRKHAPAAAPAAGGGADAAGDKGGKDEKSPEKRIRQAVYDIRYRARREDVPLRTAFAQYMQNSNLGANERSAVKAKLFGDGPMKTEQFVASAKELASESAANAMFKVFVGEEKMGADKKYKVRVEDKNGKSYVRYATRDKITELRANPNIRSVEITSYGEPYEGERKKGSQTAAAKAGRDYDGDGKVESGAKEYRGAVHNAIQRRKGGNPDGQDTSNVKEDFIADGSVHEEKAQRLDVLDPKVTNKIKIHTGKNEKLGEAKMTSAEKEEESKLKRKHDKSGSMKASMKKQYGDEEGEKIYFATIRKKAMQNAGYEPEGESIQEGEKVMKGIIDRFRDKMKEREEQGKEAEKSATCCGCDKFPCECDDRARKTSMDLYKNKLRSMGLKMSYEPEGDQLDENPVSDFVKGLGNIFRANQAKKQDPNKITSTNKSERETLQKLGMSYEPEGEVIGEEDYDRLKDRRLGSERPEKAEPINTDLRGIGERIRQGINVKKASAKKKEDSKTA